MPFILSETVLPHRELVATPFYHVPVPVGTGTGSKEWGGGKAVPILAAAFLYIPVLTTVAVFLWLKAQVDALYKLAVSIYYDFYGPFDLHNITAIIIVYDMNVVLPLR
jgi:hypothetical protein